MATGKIGRRFGRASHRLGADQGVVCVLLIALVVLLSACGGSTVTQQWTPPYLQLHLLEGGAQIQGSGESEWVRIEDGGSIVVEEKTQILADAVEGARFRLGDGSIVELSPEALMEVRDLPGLPGLQVLLLDGDLVFVAQSPSYEFVLPVCPVTLLSVPSRIQVEVNGERTCLGLEEGAATCAMGSGASPLVSCQEMCATPGEEPEIRDFCAGEEAVTPSPTPRGDEPAAMPSPWSTSTPTATPTAAPPTDTPTPSPTPPPPPPPPPPTSPPPKPTEPPPPPPTEPPRPTPAPP